MIVFLKDKNQKHSTMGECRKESHSYSTYLDLFFIRMDRYFSVLRLCIVFHLTRCLPHAFKISHIIHSLNHQEIRVEKSNFESLLFIYLFYHKKKKRGSWAQLWFYCCQLCTLDNSCELNLCCNG